MSILVLVVHGAYDRDYDNWEDCLKDWADGKDFKTIYGPYCSIRDVETLRSDGVRAIYFMKGDASILGHISLAQ